jgi:hypothetical protein
MSGILQGLMASFGGGGGEELYTSAGTYSFIVPAGVDSISYLCVGSGGRR